MPSKRQVFVVSSNTVPAPHLEFVSTLDSVVSLITSVGGSIDSSSEETVLSNPLFITTAPPITAKIANTPITMRIFFLFPLLDFFSIISEGILSGVFSTGFSFTSGFFMSLPQSRQNLEFTGMDFPHFQQ